MAKKIFINGVRIKQRKEECHYETSFWNKGMPICCGYGITQEEADTKGLIDFLRERGYIKKRSLSINSLKIT